MSNFLPPVVVELVASVGEFKAKMDEAKLKVGELEEKGNTGFSNFGKAAMVGGAVAGTALVAIGGEVLKAYNDMSSANARLDVALKNTGQNTAAMKEKISAAANGMAKYGYSGSEVTTVLADMTTRTGSATKSMSLLQAAADLATYKHISLAQAGLLVSKVSEGQTSVLKRLGIDTGIASVSAQTLTKDQTALAVSSKKYQEMQQTGIGLSNNHAKAMVQLEAAHQKLIAAQQKLTSDQHAGNDAMAALEKRLGGSANSASQTLSGTMSALGATVNDLFESLAEKLTPAISKVTEYIRAGTSWLMEHKAAMTTVALVIGGVLVAALAVATAAMISFAAAQVAATWPILAVMAAIAVLVAGIVLLWNNCELFRDIVIAAWNLIKDTTIVVFNIIKTAITDAWDVIKVLFQMTPIGFVITHWNMLKDVTETVFDAVKTAISDVWDWITTAFKLTPVGMVITYWNQLKDATEKVFNSVKNAIKVGIDAVVNFATEVFDTVKNVLTWFGGLELKVLDVFKNAGTWLFNVGKNIVQGLLDGAGSLLSTIGDFFLSKLPGWIVGPFKAALGIQSPSTIFFDHGVNIVQGLIDGMESMKDAASGSIAGIAAGISSSGGVTIPVTAQGMGAVTAPTSTTAGAGGVRDINVSMISTADPHVVAKEVAWLLKVGA